MISYGLVTNPTAPDEDYAVPICPICFAECEYIYYDKDREILGCDNCVNRDDAYDEPKCFK